jgi:hypothetical protein
MPSTVAANGPRNRSDNAAKVIPPLGTRISLLSIAGLTKKLVSAPVTYIIAQLACPNKQEHRPVRSVEEKTEQGMFGLLLHLNRIAGTRMEAVKYDPSSN